MFLLMLFTCSTQVKAEMTKDQFGDLMNKVEENLPLDWSVDGYGYYQESQGRTVILVMDSHKDSKNGYLNPLFRNLEKAKIVDFYGVELPKDRDKSSLGSIVNNKMFSYLYKSKLNVIGTEKKRLRNKAESLLKKINNHLTKGIHVEKLPELYADFMKNIDDRSEYAIMNTMQKKKVWKDSKVCILIFGEWHMEYMLSCLEKVKMSWIFLLNEKIYTGSRKSFESLRKRCLGKTNY